VRERAAAHPELADFKQLRLDLGQLRLFRTADRARRPQPVPAVAVRDQDRLQCAKLKPVPVRPADVAPQPDPAAGRVRRGLCRLVSSGDRHLRGAERRRTDEVALAAALHDVGQLRTRDPTPAELDAALAELIRVLVENYEADCYR
jgi:hypothetical protein